VLEPAMIQGSDPAGQVQLEDVPAEFMLDEQPVAVSIQRIHADQGAVLLSIPQLFASQEVERLILDISKKPLIMLVWFGTTFILLGSLIVMIRRMRELTKIKRRAVSETPVLAGSPVK